MKKNQRCIVSENAPHHANRIGFFQFYGEGASAGVAVLATEPVDQRDGARVLFAVASNHIEEDVQAHLCD